MRRKEREIKDQHEIAKILHNATVLRLAMCKENMPYLVPLSFGYDDKCLYFHCAHEGQKIDFLRANAQVCFEVEGRVAIKTHAEKPCNWGFSYESVIGRGTAEELTATSGKQEALGCIMKQYSDAAWEFSENELKAVSVWKINIEELTGKQA